MATCRIIPPAPNNEDSILFKEALKFSNNNRKQAILAYGVARSNNFKEWFGDWEKGIANHGELDVNGEPSYKEVLQYQIALMNKQSYVDDLIPTASTPFLAVAKKKVDNLYKQRNVLKDKFAKTTDIKERNSITRDLEAIKFAIDDVAGQQEKLKDINNIKQVFSIAKQDINELESILSQDFVSEEEIFYADKIIDLWKAAGDFEAEEHLFLDEDERNTEEIRNTLLEFRATVENHGRKLTGIKKQRLEEFIRKTLGSEISSEEIWKAMSDDWGLKTKTLNIGRHDSAILQAIHRSVEDANFLAQQEANIRFKTLDDLLEKALPKLDAMGGNTPFDVFKQETANGKLTGNMVFRFTQEFFNTRKRMLNSAKGADISDSLRKKLWADYYKWQNDNTITFDPRYLFADGQGEESSIPKEFIFSGNEGEFSEEGKAAHVAELKKQLGEKGYATYLKSLEKNIEKYRLEREAVWDNFSTQDLSEEEKTGQFRSWLLANSPYAAMEMAENPNKRTKANGKQHDLSFRYTVNVPRRFAANGEETGLYDSKFDKIEGSEEVLALYEHMLAILDEVKSVLPQNKKDLLQINSLPSIEKSLIDMFSEKGMKMGAAPLMDKMRESLRTRSVGTEGTAEDEKSINIQFIPNNKERITRGVDLRIVEFEQSEGRKPTSMEMVSMREDTIDEIANEKSYDLGKILKAYSLMGLGYKHKSAIEDKVRLAHQMFSDIKNAETNAEGEILTDRDTGKVIPKGNLTNFNASLDFFLDSSFYNLPTRDIEGAVEAGGKPKKIFTSVEKVKKQRLESAIQELTVQIADAKTDTVKEKLEKRLVNLEADLASLGGVLTKGDIGDTVLKYAQIKGMGWNIFSAFSNVGFGFIANWIEAGDGRDFSQAQLKKGYLMTMDSVGANYTFDSLKTTRAKKIRHLMDNLDVLQEASSELYKQSDESSLTKNAKRFGAYNAQKRSEYVNQAPLMIAKMLATEVTGPNGEITNLWEAMDNLGNLKEGHTVGEKGEQAGLAQFKAKLKKIIEKTHGDYGNPLMIKKSFLGRASSQFRTWMFEGFANRFEDSYKDHTLGYERKGRYKTGFGVVSWAQNTGMNGIQQTLFNLKQLGRKLLWQNTQYDEAGFSEVDAANMRKNLNELIMLMSVYALGLLLSNFSDDDDKNENLFMVNFLINQNNRLQTDILFYSNPIEFERLTKSALPIMNLVQEAGQWFNAAGRQFGDKPNVQTGPFKDMNWLLRETLEMTPGPAQGMRLYKTVENVLE